MTVHLTDEQLTDVLLGQAGGDTQRHLESCEACRREASTVDGGIRAYVDTARVAAPTAAGDLRYRRSRAWVSWSGALAAAAAVVVWISVAPRPSNDAPAALDADHELLLSVERSLRRDVPSALEPASLIVADIGEAGRAALARP